MSTDPKQGDKLPPRNDIVKVAAIVQQLEDLVKLTLECENKELKPNVSFIAVNKKLQAIRQDVERFKEMYRNSLAKVNLRPEDVKPTPEEIAALGPKERAILEKLKDLQGTCEDARERIHQSLRNEKAGVNVLKGETKDKAKEKYRRQGKFKGVGGKKDWLPT